MWTPRVREEAPPRPRPAGLTCTTDFAPGAQVWRPPCGPAVTLALTAQTSPAGSSRCAPPAHATSARTSVQSRKQNLSPSPCPVPPRTTVTPNKVRNQRKEKPSPSDTPSVSGRGPLSPRPGNSPASGLSPGPRGLPAPTLIPTGVVCRRDRLPCRPLYPWEQRSGLQSEAVWVWPPGPHGEPLPVRPAPDAPSCICSVLRHTCSLLAGVSRPCPFGRLHTCWALPGHSGFTVRPGRG